jgi:uroporphyrinogen-III synthase
VAWVEWLHARGVDALALPLIEIAAPADPHAVEAAWQGLGGRAAVVFVSANAVERFFAGRPAGVAWPQDLLAAVPGPGTAESLRRRELERRDWRGRSVLVVRGDGGRDWLVERLVEAGASVDAVAAYRRLPPRLSDEARRELDEVLAAPSRHAWLFSSSEAIANLEALAGVAVPAGARALATHPRIAARARRAGFTEVIEVPPGLDAVVACIQSMQP